jgi:hypothetical protein
MDHLPPRSEEATKKLQEGHRKGRKRPGNLREQVDQKTMMMYPTPRATEIDESVETWTKREKKRKDKGLAMFSKNLSMTVKMMYPTPTASDVEGGVAKDVQNVNGRFFRQNENGEKWGVKLRDAVNHMERKKMLPIPTTRDYKDSGNISNWKENRERMSLPRAVHQQQNTGQLNAEWVTWLMGYPKHYLDISPKNQKTSQELPKTKKIGQKS